MKERSVATLLVSVLCVSMFAVTGPATAETTRAASASTRGVAQFRPDQWIKLCGLSTGCTIDPPPHPWLGNDVYNTNGRRQRVAVRMEDGEGVRFWLRIESDGTDADTIRVQGCRSTPRFVINAVLVGKHKRPEWRAKNVTRRFKNGTLEFDFPGSSTARKFLTLNIVAPTTAEGVTHRCRVTIVSQGDPSSTDTVVAIMTTY